ncbi:hypothetical protein LDENG_00065660 [Lucifuga dentata]|nr:hypothetical protein LDENG_00065660 [Lucifuga dentata]
MEVCESVSQQDRLQLIAEKRKWQTEIENKKRQLEDDRRVLQHLKSKALRERWLLDGAPSAEQDEVKRQLEQDEAKTRSLEETINRMEQELISLETGGCQIKTHTVVSPGSVKAVEVKGQSSHQQDRPVPSGQVVKVVHEMNGENDVHLLSSTEVDELIHKAGEASMMSETVAMATSLPTVEHQQEEGGPAPPLEAKLEPDAARVEITGLEAEPDAEPGIAEASAENPVTMVFMGYQNVEDEAETKKVLGLQGTVKAELVLIEDSEGKTSPGGSDDTTVTQMTQMVVPPPSNCSTVSTQPTAKGPETTVSNGEKAAEPEGGAVEINKKQKQPCKCCTIM